MTCPRCSGKLTQAWVVSVEFSSVFVAAGVRSVFLVGPAGGLLNGKCLLAENFGRLGVSLY